MLEMCEVFIGQTNHNYSIETAILSKWLKIMHKTLKNKQLKIPMDVFGKITSTWKKQMWLPFLYKVSQNQFLQFFKSCFNQCYRLPCYVESNLGEDH